MLKRPDKIRMYKKYIKLKVKIKRNPLIEFQNNQNNVIVTKWLVEEIAKDININQVIRNIESKKRTFD